MLKLKSIFFKAVKIVPLLLIMFCITPNFKIYNTFANNDTWKLITINNDNNNSYYLPIKYVQEYNSFICLECKYCSKDKNLNANNINTNINDSKYIVEAKNSTNSRNWLIIHTDRIKYIKAENISKTLRVPGDIGVVNFNDSDRKHDKIMLKNKIKNSLNIGKEKIQNGEERGQIVIGQNENYKRITEPQVFVHTEANGKKVPYKIDGKHKKNNSNGTHHYIILGKSSASNDQYLTILITSQAHKGKSYTILSKYTEEECNKKNINRTFRAALNSLSDETTLESYIVGQLKKEDMKKIDEALVRYLELDEKENNTGNNNNINNTINNTNVANNNVNNTNIVNNNNNTNNTAYNVGVYTPTLHFIYNDQCGNSYFKDQYNRLYYQDQYGYLYYYGMLTQHPNN